MLGLALAGCYEPPNYRYVVTSSGQGNVQVSTVPKDPDPTPTAPAAAVPVASPDASQQRIDDLEARVRQLSAENERLKHRPTTAPTTRQD